METNNVTREKPTLTVLEKSRELHILLSKITLDDNFLAKAFRYSIGKPVTDHSQFIYESLAVANTLDLYDNELFPERKKNQVAALRELTKLLASVRILYSVGNFSSDKMLVLLNQIIEVERLLKKWIESDENRRGMALNVVKKDVIKTDLFTNKITARDLFDTGVHVSFDELIKDARSMPIQEKNEKPIFVPPASSLPKPSAPAPIVVKMTDEERRADFMKSRFDLNRVGGRDINPPKLVATLPKAEFAIPTKEPAKIVVPAAPIVVPDNRIEPEPKPDIEVENAKPLAKGVEVVTGSAEMVVTGDQPEKDEKTPMEKEAEALAALQKEDPKTKDQVPEKKEEK